MPGASKCQERDPEPDESEARERRVKDGTRHEERPQSECRSEHRLARELVEHQRVAGIREQGHARRECHPRPESEADRCPGDDRACIQQRGDRLGQHASTDVEKDPGHDWRQGRPEEHRPREKDVPVEELDVGVEVLVEVAARFQRPGDRLDGVDTERHDEEDERAQWPGRQTLEPGQGAGDTCLHRCHAPIA